MYCRYCGTDIGDKDAFCLNCGKPTDIQTASTGPKYVNANDVLTETEQRIVGKNVDFYLRKFAKMKFGSNITWNWAAFFFGAFWMIYRKMYAWAAIAFVVKMFILPADGGIITAIIFGLIGNSLYHSRVKSLAAEADGIFDPAQREKFIHSKGGTSVFALFVLFGVMVVFLVLFITLAYTAYLYI